MSCSTELVLLTLRFVPDFDPFETRYSERPAGDFIRDIVSMRLEPRRFLLLLVVDVFKVESISWFIVARLEKY